jgi:hypothetical protein
MKYRAAPFGVWPLLFFIAFQALSRAFLSVDSQRFTPFFMPVQNPNYYEENFETMPCPAALLCTLENESPV